MLSTHNAGTRCSAQPSKVVLAELPLTRSRHDTVMQ